MENIRDYATQSAGGIIYYIEQKTNQPKFLLVKRYALSKKIEWVAPKGKIMPGETPQQAAIREISEETGIKKQYLILKQQVGVLNISLHSQDKGSFEKDITYFLFEYKGDPTNIKIQHGEGFLGVYNWFTIQEILGLIYYPDVRELFRKAYSMIFKS